MLALSRVTTKTNKVDHTHPTSLKVEKFSDLIEFVSIMQSLKNEIYYDAERCYMGKHLDLKFCGSNPCVIEISSLIFDGTDDCLTEFKIDISDNNNEVKFGFKIVIDKSKFELKLPRRSAKLRTVSKELFLIEKTGDLYQVLPSGQCKFLLGHLFTLSDIQFITRGNDEKILYIITVDRDEKIRVTNWPDTYEIERFCFGHKQLVRRLITVDESRFISIDQQDEICLWNLNNLSVDSEKPLYPERVFSLDECAKKRVCVRVGNS
jgi:WD40 repeat protein